MNGVVNPDRTLLMVAPVLDAFRVPSIVSVVPPPMARVPPLVAMVSVAVDRKVAPPFNDTVPDPIVSVPAETVASVDVELAAVRLNVEVDSDPLSSAKAPSTVTAPPRVTVLVPPVPGYRPAQRLATCVAVSGVL